MQPDWQVVGDLNELWAHIEVCASIFTACLPTLGPLFKGGYSLRTILNSLRSTFSLRSGAASDASYSKGRASSGHSSADPSIKEFTGVHDAERGVGINTTCENVGQSQMVHNNIVVEKSVMVR